MQTIQCISAEDDTVHRAVQFVNTCMCSGLVGVRVPPPPPPYKEKFNGSHGIIQFQHGPKDPNKSSFHHVTCSVSCSSLGTKVAKKMIDISTETARTERQADSVLLTDH